MSKAPSTGKWAALLRGVNVGGGNTVPMAELRGLAERLGWQEVRSYIASGNLVFRAEGQAEALSEALRAAMLRGLNVNVPVLVLPGRALEMARDSCPFDPDEGRHVHAYLLWAEPEVDWDLVADLRADSEELAIKGRIAWLHAPDGVGRSKLAARMGKVLRGTDFTARNLNTLSKLVDMLDL